MRKPFIILALHQTEPQFLRPRYSTAPQNAQYNWRVCVCVRACMRPWVCLCVRMYARARARARARVCVCVCVCVCVQ